MFMKKKPSYKSNKPKFLSHVLLMPHVGYVTALNYSLFYIHAIERLEVCVNEKLISIIK